MSLLNELKRRDVIRVTSAYVVFCWLIVQIVETLFPVYGLSDQAIRNVILLLGLGFFPTLILSWIFEITVDGSQAAVGPGCRGSPGKTRVPRLLTESSY